MSNRGENIFQLGYALLRRKKGEFFVLSIIVFISFGFLGRLAFSENTKEVSLTPVVEKAPLKEVMPEFQEKEEVTLLFVGDIMFDRYIRQMAMKDGYDVLLENAKDILLGSDGVIGNLEGPITENTSRSIGSAVGSRDNYFFTFDKEIANVLKRYNFKILHLGNNHILNFGQEGYKSTVSYLDEAGIASFGGGGRERESVIEEIQGISFAFVSYNTFGPYGETETVNAISHLRKQVDYVIVFVHWGEEYKIYSNVSQQELGRIFVDSGADLVIGSHPHVVQEMEIYKGKRIYYSLGNFVFDQYFSEDVKRGLVVEARIKGDESNFAFQEYDAFMTPNGKTAIKTKASQE